MLDATAPGTKLLPLGPKVICRIAPKQTVTAGGILLPDNSQRLPITSEVLEVGPGRTNDSGVVIPIHDGRIRPGCIVLHEHFAGCHVGIGGNDYNILDEKDILAIVVQ